MMMMMMMVIIDFFAVWLTDDRRSLISSGDHCQRSSPSRIPDTPQVGFEPAQNLSSGFDEYSCAVVITTTPRHHSICSVYWGLTNFLRIITDIHDYFQSIEDKTANKIIPAISGGNSVNNTERKLISPSTRYGGLAVLIMKDTKYDAARNTISSTVWIVRKED